LDWLREEGLWGEVDAAQARALLGWLYEDRRDWLTYLWLREPDGKGAAITLPGTIAELCDHLDDASLSDLVNGSDELGTGPRQVYFGVGRTQRRYARHDRAKTPDIVAMPCVFLDLDRKPGGSGFATAEAVASAWEWLRSEGLDFAAVSTGSGGLHLYGRVPGAGLSPAGYRESVDRLRALIAAKFGVDPDRVADATRVARLAGSARWPKHDEYKQGVCVAPVRLACDLDAAGWLDLERLWELTENAWQDACRVAETTRREYLRSESVDGAEPESVIAARTELLAVLERGEEAVWPLLWDAYGETAGSGLDGAARAFSRIVAWESALVPKGWGVHEDTDHDGRRQVTRPSRGAGDRPNPRSGTVGYGDDPDAPMSLLSCSASTGLLGLVEAGLRLTKVRVAAALWTGGDVGRLLRAWEAAGRPAELDGIEGL
jgi:hypothetical protein